MKTALIFSHPHFDASKANRALIDAVRDVRGIEIAHLDSLYPDGRIDLEAETERLLGADRIVLQFPMFWYATPPLLKAWIDAVMTPLLYIRPEIGARLAGKPLRLAVTTGGPADSYGPEGQNRFTVDELFTPLRAMAHRCGFVWEPPFLAHDMHAPGPEALAVQGARYRALLDDRLQAAA